MSRCPVMTNLCVGHLRQNVPLRTSPAIGFTMNSFSLRHVLFRRLRVGSPCGACGRTKLPPKPLHVPAVEKLSTILGRVGRGCLCVYTGRSFSKQRGFTIALTRRGHGTGHCQTRLGEQGVQ